LAGTGREGTMRVELAAAVCDLFKSVTLPRDGPTLSGAEQTRLIALASLAALCRSGVERDPYTRDIIQIYQPESPARLAKVLARLLAGLLALGVEHHTAWTILTKVGLDCVPTLRRLAFDHLIARPATGSDAATTESIARATGYQPTTIRRSLQELAAHGVVVEGRAGEAGKAAEWAISAEARELYDAATGSP
ncbi:MAG: hypothetical protein M3248_07605, partial [Actinomycetota bacterium]|nr:hypothetical protein [Actinomycetota bacterium]